MRSPERPILIGSDIFRQSRHASGHPLAIPRVSLAIDLCRALGWLPDAAYRESPRASPEELAQFHVAGYIAAVQDAEREQEVSDEVRRRFNLGVNGNAIYREMFRRPATACGASLMAARMLSARPGIVYNPAGGTHHGQRDRASGYCIFNDPALAILQFLDAGVTRVFYLDLDAHFGDGVQQAFHDDERVFTLSVHEEGRWPMSRAGAGQKLNGGPQGGAGPGSVHDRAGGAARNLPVPPGFNDAEMAFLRDEVIVPLITAFAPEVLVVQCGADALADDPMTRLALSNGALWSVIAATASMAPRLLVLGGGGYNPYAVARCWAGVWAALNEIAAPERLPAAAEALLREVRWNHRLGRNPPPAWTTTLADPPSPGAIRSEVREVARLALRP